MAKNLILSSFLFATGASLDPSIDPRDLQRARTKIPRAGWKGNNFNKMSEVLNGHLKKIFPKTKPCNEWTLEELQDYQGRLYGYRHADFDAIYNGTADNRRMRFNSLEDHKKHWGTVNGHSRERAHLREMHRDGHCHEAVMWLIHHVPAAEQHTVFSRIPAPLLSSKRHTCSENPSEAEAEVCKLYHGLTSCADCHSDSGMLCQDCDDIPGIIPEDPKYPGWARQRRCDQNYDPPCGPCGGVGGPYWGDGVSSFQPTNCEVVSLPEDVPESDRQSPQFAEQFIVHQLGSDRLARTQNAQKFPPALYSQIRSTLWYDFPLGGESDGKAEDGMAKLRHDTYYDDLAYKWFDDGLVSEIHTQTRAQREANSTGPMLSLVHGLLGYGKYLGGVTCLPDPVGVPVLSGIVDVAGRGRHSAFLGADYLGRIKIGVEYDGFKVGDEGHGDMKAKRNMTVDHYIKWFLHLFVDADKTSPTYGQPVRFYGPYAGFAVYVKFEKTAPPAEVWEQACPDNGWGQPEKRHECVGKKITDYACMVVSNGTEVCKPYAPNGISEELRDIDRLHGAFGSVVMHPELKEEPILV